MGRLKKAMKSVKKVPAFRGARRLVKTKVKAMHQMFDFREQELITIGYGSEFRFAPRIIFSATRARRVYLFLARRARAAFQEMILLSYNQNFEMLPKYNLYAAVWPPERRPPTLACQEEARQVELGCEGL